MARPTIPLMIGELGRATRVLGEKVGTVVTPVVKKTFKAFGELWVGGWFTKAVVTLFELFLLDEIASLMSTFVNTIWAGTLLVFADNNPKLAANAIQVIADEITKQTPLAGILAATTIEQITGITIDKDKLFDAATGADRHAYQVTMGDEFTQVVSTMLNVNLAKADFQTRTGFAGSFSNLSSYFGTNLDFQLRSLTIGTISSMFGWQSLRHLEGLHQSINWAFGFGWLSWSVLSNAMDVTVNAGVKRFYLSQVKPHDLSQSQANKALIRRMIGVDTWNQIHDNVGNRNDARDWQLQLEFNQPSVSEIKTGYQHNELSTAQVDELMIAHEFTPQGAQLVRTSIVDGRKWDLEKQVASERLRHVQRGWEQQDAARTQLVSMGWSNTEVDLALRAHERERIYHLRDAVTAEHMKFLRHGLETQDEARQWLNSQGWSEEEIALAFEANRLEQKAVKQAKPHQLSQTQLKLAMKYQLMSATDVHTYLLNQGYDEIDALIILIEDEIANLPTLKDCGDPFDAKHLLPAIAAVLKLAGFPATPSGLLKWAECAVTKL